MKFYLVTYESYGDLKRDRYCQTTAIAGPIADWVFEKSRNIRGGGILLRMLLPISEEEYLYWKQKARETNDE